MLLYALHWQRINFYVSAQSALEELPPTLRLDKLAEYPLTEGQFMELSELLHQANGGRLTNYKQRTGYDPLQAAHPPTMLHGSFVLDFNPATDALQAIQLCDLEASPLTILPKSPARQHRISSASAA